MVYCQKCGAKNTEDANYCEGCGKSLKETLAEKPDKKETNTSQKQQDKSSWDNILNDTNSGYCPNCKQKVVPIKKIGIVWGIIHIILAVWTYGAWILIYLSYYLLLKPKQCPMCGYRFYGLTGIGIAISGIKEQQKAFTNSSQPTMNPKLKNQIDKTGKKYGNILLYILIGIIAIWLVAGILIYVSLKAGK